MTSTTNTSAYAINCFHIHIRQYHLKKLTYKKKKRRKHERGSKNLPSNALVSPCLCDGLVSVINMGFFFSGTDPVHVWLSVSLPVCSVCGLEILMLFSCQQLWREWGWMFLLQSLKERRRCWTPLRAPAGSLPPPAQRHSPLKHRECVVKSNRAFILKQPESRPLRTRCYPTITVNKYMWHKKII